VGSSSAGWAKKVVADPARFSSVYERRERATAWPRICRTGLGGAHDEFWLEEEPPAWVPTPPVASPMRRLVVL
jgi:hypothetical protein